MPSTPDLIKHLIDVCYRLYAKGFVAATDGNVSVRCGNGNFLTTRTSVNKGMVSAEDFVEVDASGDPVEGALKAPPARRPSTEIGMHLFIYSRRPDVQAIVHAHPPYATGFATAGIALDRCVAPEVIVGLGAIPLAAYATPSTAEVAASKRIIYDGFRAALGRGEDDGKVGEWLGVAAKVPGFVGFAVGRTVFWGPLVDWHAGKASREQAAERIAGRYREFVNIFEEG